MAQEFQCAKMKLDNGSVITMFYVQYSSVSTPQVSQQSIAAFKNRFPKDEIILVAKDFSLAPLFIGKPDLVDRIKHLQLNQIPWTKINL